MKIQIQRTILWLSLFLWSLIIVVPILWTVATSFKTNREFYGNPWQLPESLNFENYITAWNSANMADYFLNSILVTAVSLTLLLILSSQAAYVLARFSFPFRRTIEISIISALFIPKIFQVVPIFKLVRNLGLFDTHVGLGLVYISINFALSVFILIGFYRSLPKELEEAAWIDGSGYFQTYRTIMFPLAQGGLVTVGVLQFLAIWNEYVMALVLLASPVRYTIPVGLVNLMEVQRYRTDWGALFAGLVISMIPAFIIYILGQSKITEGITAGAVKG